VDCAPAREKKGFSSLLFYFFLDEPPRQKDGITDFHLKLFMYGLYYLALLYRTELYVVGVIMPPGMRLSLVKRVCFRRVGKHV
jgi:hypothetical protein